MDFEGNSITNYHIGNVEISENLNVLGTIEANDLQSDTLTVVGDINAGSLIVEGFKYISVKSDFPTPVAGVITLLASNTYYINGDIDLTGDRLLGSDNTVLIGDSSENSILTSTGLGVGVALFTTAHTTPIRNIEFKDVDTALNISNAGTAVFDWVGINFLNVPNIGTIDGVGNFIFIDGAFLNSSGMVFTGSTGTVSFSGCLFVGDNQASDMITLDSNSIITRRFRIIYSAFVVPTNNTAIEFDAGVTIPVEGFILDTINFSGSGTYLNGITDQDNDSLFVNCVGISNTYANGQIYMSGNVTSTTIADTTTFVKVAGTTIPGENSKFTGSTSNRLTCDASIVRKYLITCNLTFTTGNNKVCEFGFYDSTDNVVLTPSRSKSTSNAGGRGENVSFSDIHNLIETEYLEIHCRNTTDTTNIVVTDMNVVVVQL